MADPYVTFPGTAGNYASRADTNLLDADSAHLYQGTGKWFIGASVAEPSSTFGGRVLRYGAGAGSGFNNSGNIPITVGETYSYVLRVRAAATPDPSDVANVYIEWRDGGGGYVGDSGIEVAAIGDGAWHQVMDTSVAPVGTVQAALIVQTVLTAGIDIDVDWAIIRMDAVQVFVPSLRIVGDLDLRADAAPVDYTPATLESFLGRNAVYTWSLNPSGLLVMAFNDETNTSQFATSTVAAGLVDGSRHSFRTNLRPGGLTQHYIDDVQLGADVVTPGTGIWPNQDRDLGVAANKTAGSAQEMAGNFYTAEVRDGISGPIVAQFRAQDLIGAVPL